MKKILWLAALAASFLHPASADQPDCTGQGCRSTFILSSTSELRTYGVMIVAPPKGCRMVRFRVEAEGDVFLGQTSGLVPGELAVVRMGKGFAPGEHRLTVASEGCAAFPSRTRRVTHAKQSPDHGWRAAMASGG